MNLQKMNDVHSSLLVGASRLDIVGGALPDSRVPLLRAIDVVMREVVSVGGDESIGAHWVCNHQATAVEEAFPDFLT